MKFKKYTSYQDYVTHQVSKQHNRDLGPNNRECESVKKYEHDFKCALIRRIWLNPKKPVESGFALCLGARMGSEVEAFEFCKVRASGIDLYPAGPKVIKGDFHNIPFKDKSFDMVYTNSLDHSLYPAKMFEEAKRVLKDTGAFMLEIPDVNSGRASFGQWECVEWKNTEEITELLVKVGFRVINMIPFEFPWWGLSITATKA